MADVNRGNRPLSPHLAIYRPQLTSMTSILTRITGNALLISTLLVVWWFLSAALSAEYFAYADGVLTSWFGDIVLTLSVLGLWYHTLAGLRHLIWDMGYGLEVEQAEKMGIVCLVGSVVLTLITVLVV